MGGLLDVLSRLAKRRSRARKGRGGAKGSDRRNRFRAQRFEPLEDRRLLAAAYPLAQTFQLHSAPTASTTIFLDFDGNITSGTLWNAGRGDIITPAYSLDADPSFNDTELEQIQHIWERVAEDYLPFNVDVTTQDPGQEALRNSGGDDERWGIRVAIGGFDATIGGVGAAQRGSFNWPSDTPAFVFTDSTSIAGDEKYTAEETAYQVGVSLGLNPMGTSAVTFYAGHGTGPTGWAPIMGWSYDQELTQWSKGEYPDANNQEDELALITGGYTNENGNNGFDYRADDVGNTPLTATALTMAGRTAASGSGIIERNTDIDYFRFTTGPGAVSIDVAPFYRGPNLDVLATLYDSAGMPAVDSTTGNTIDAANPTDLLTAGFNVTLSAGTYYVAVQGTGKAATDTDPGYTNYGSLGYYSIAATLQPVYGVAVSPISGPTTEAGGTATFTLVLNCKQGETPTANVTVGLSSNDLTEGKLSVSSVIFTSGTSGNWNVPQTVTVTGVDDVIDDGDISYKIVTAPCQSTDANYRNVDPDDVTVVNLDNDTAGFTISPTSGLLTSEDATTARFTVALSCQPTGNVTLPLQSSKVSEGTISTNSLTFTPADWATPQTVTVTGVDDTVVDGPIVYPILTQDPTSSGLTGDPAFDRLTPADVPDVSVTNLDNDPGFVVVPNPPAGTPSTLATTEAGGTATFTVMPSFQPTAPVTVTFTSSRPAEGSLGVSTFVFSTANWNQAQTVTVTGVDDYVIDPSQNYQITGAGTSGDARFNLAVPTVNATNNDNDTAGFAITPTSGLSTTEQGGRATFTVKLTSRPASDVTLTLNSSDPTEGTISSSTNVGTDPLKTPPMRLVFAPARWNVDQTVTIAGVNDDVDDGNVTYSIITDLATSSDGDYSIVNPPDVSVVNINDDTAGFVYSRTFGLVTAEYGATDAFTVRLTSQPTADVRINFSSDTTSEGTLQPAFLKFTFDNWNTPQAITLRGVDDSIVDGPKTYHVTSTVATFDDKYLSLAAPPVVSATNLDDDSSVGGKAPGFKFSRTGGIVTREPNGTDTFTVQLATQPTAAVTLGLTSSNTAEGDVSTSSLVFTTSGVTDGWNVPHTVTVTGVDDIFLDGAVDYQIVTAAATSADSNYSGLDPADLWATNMDDPNLNDDVARIVVNPASGLVTSENGTTDTFTVQLSNPATADVKVYLYPSNNTEGRLSSDVLTFTPATWNVAQTVTVTGVDDLMADGPIDYKVIVAPAASSDLRWNGAKVVSDVGVTNTDNDTAGVTVAPSTTLQTNENGLTATFTVVLATQPVGNAVTIGLTSDDPAPNGEGSVSAAEVIFDKINWNVPQTVTVTGLPDSIIDGDQIFHIVTGAAVSDGLDYNQMPVADVTVVNRDTDVARVVITPLSGLTTTEAEGTATATFTVVLASKPNANSTVSFSLSSNDTTEGTLAKRVRSITRSGTTATVTVSAAHGFAGGATVLISGADQAEYNGAFVISNVTPNTFTYQVSGAPLSPATGPIAALAVKSVSITRGGTGGTVATVNAPGHGFSAGNLVQISGADQSQYNGIFRVNTVSPDGNTFTYTVAGAPVSPASGKIIANLAGLTFTPATWNVPQTVTVTGLDDAYQDGNVSYLIVTGPCVTNSTADPYYNLAVDDVSLVNTDDDRIEIRRAPASGLVTHETDPTTGGTITFDVWLGSRPNAAVSVHFTSSDATEGSVLTSDLSWTPAEWQAHKIVTIKGLDDLIDDGDVSYAIHAVASSTDPAYNGLAMQDVQATNYDDLDTAGIEASSPSGSGLTHEWGSTVTFTVKLTSEPVDYVVVPLTSNNRLEGLPSPSSLRFTAANWNIPQTVTVTGQDDHVPDGLADYRILLGPAQSPEAVYQDLTGAPVLLQNVNDAPWAINPTVDYTTPVVTADGDKGLVIDAPGVLANFSDDGPLSQLAVVAMTQPAYGTLQLSPSGDFTYTPRQHFAGIDEFICQVTDGQGLAAQAKVQITIGTGEQPIGVDLPSKLWEGQAKDGTGTVSRGASDPATSDLTVFLTSPNSNQITLPQSVVIRAGQTSVSFGIGVIDDTLYNGRRTVEVWASALGYLTSQKTLEVGDNELHHFAYAPFAGQQIAGVPFSVEMFARDINDETIEDYQGPCVFSAAGTAGAVSLTTSSVVLVNGKYTFDATVNALATGVQLTASDDDKSHSGTSGKFDVVHGALDHFRWTSDPLLYQQATTPFSVQLAAYDSHDYPVTDLAGTMQLSGWVSTGAASSIVISEIADKNGYDLASRPIPDFIELENVGSTTVNMWNWQLLANNPDAGLNAFQTRVLSDMLAMNARDTVMVSDSSADANASAADRYYFGEGLHWGQGTGKGWVMLVDQNQNLVDFLAWGYSQAEIETLAVPVGSNTLRPAGTFWNASGVPYNKSEGLSLQRTGSHDRNVADDFVWGVVAITRPSQNPGLNSLFTDVLRPITVSPTTTSGFVNGRWSGLVTINQSVQNMFLEADGMGFTVDSQPFTVGSALPSALASTPALVDPASSVFYVKLTNTGGYADRVFGYGAPGQNWIPLAGDWNGDGITTAGMYDPASSCFYLTNSTGGGVAQMTFGFGQANAGWLPVVGDWDGNGVDTIGLYDPQSSTFHLANKNQTGFADLTFGYGQASGGWTPIAGDWDGDGVDSVGLYVPSASTFYLRNANTTGMADYSVAFGQGGAGWKPVVGDWNADRMVTIGVYDPASSVFYERDSNTSGYADHAFGFGQTNRGWIPLAGDWNGAEALHAADVGSADLATPLTSADLTASVGTALAQWNALGLDPAVARRLADVEIVVADLPGTQLGLADGNRIYLDSTAAGHGWFIDSTPAANEEFSGDGQLRAVDPQAVDRVDLLSVVDHELGHVAGLEHLESGLMSATLPTGLRRLPGLAERDALFAAGLADNEG